MENRAKRELERKRLIIQGVLCVLVPPLGMLLVWRSRHEGLRKLIMTIGATVVLMIMFCIALGMREPEQIVPPVFSAGFSNSAEQEAEPTPVPVPEATLPPETPVEQEGFIAPANPNG